MLFIFFLGWFLWVCRRRSWYCGRTHRKTHKKHPRKNMKSMTGYGEASHNLRSGKVTVQIRSLNHRHLDLQLRVPREYLAFEEEIRKTLREKISRGRVDLFINRYAAKGHARKLEMD